MYIYLSVQRHPLLREVHKLMSTTLNDAGLVPVSYTPLTLPTNKEREILVLPGSFKKTNFVDPHHQSPTRFD